MEQEKNESGSCVRRLQFPITEQEQGETVWNYLTRKKKFTKMQVKRMKFRQNGICINGTCVRVTHVLTAGEVLEVCVGGGKRETPAGELQKIQRTTETKEKSNASAGKKEGEKRTDCGEPEILYEDPDVLAVWKPHGMVLHPSHGHYGDTLMDQVREVLAIRDGGRNLADPLHCIGRLDRDTSGIVVFARNQVAAQRLWQQRQDGRFQKQYFARCEGQVPAQNGGEQCICKPIAKVPGELNRMQAEDAGMRAVTFYRVMREFPKETWLLLRLETGRTHQIRVHMAWMGHPLVGDSLYGNGIAGKTYAALSACAAVFFQPFSGEKIVLNYLDKAQSGE